MIFPILAFVIGLIYGYVKPGKENRWELLKKGVMFGVILGVILGLFGFVLTTVLMPNHTFAGVFVVGLFFAASVIGIFLYIVFLVLLFIVGTFIGDLLEAALKKPT